MAHTSNTYIDHLFVEALSYASKSDERFLEQMGALSSGHSAHSGRFDIFLPGSVMSSFDDLARMPRWDVEVCLNDGSFDQPARAYTPLERFAYFIGNLAVSIYKDRRIIEVSQTAAARARFKPEIRLTSVTVNGMPFTVYCDPTTGAITNVHVGRGSS